MGEVVGFSVTGLLLGASEGLLDGFEVGTSVTGLLLGVSLGLFEGTDVGWIGLLKEKEVSLDICVHVDMICNKPTYHFAGVRCFNWSPRLD